METILVSLVCMALIVISTVTLTVSTFQSASRLADSWQTMEQTSSNLARTEISAVAPADYAGGILDFTVQKGGQINLADFPGWDVIVRYQSGDVQYLTYSATYPPAANQWTVKGIYMLDGNPEVFDPDILDPGEMMTVSANLSPEISQGETAAVTVSTPNGVTAQCYVTRK